MGRIEVLDHGYIDIAFAFSSDEEIIRTARTSTQKGFEGWEPFTMPDGRKVRGDKHLLRYLRDNDHASPFAFAGACVEVKAPLFVVGQWRTHLTQTNGMVQYNQASARYAPLPEEDFLPTPERIVQGSAGAGANKQAQGSQVISHDDAAYWIGELRRVQNQASAVYQSGLDIGVPRELARMALTEGRYTKMRCITYLRFWLDFLVQRQSDHAQEEIRMYANALNTQLTIHFPRTMGLFNEARG